MSTSNTSPTTNPSAHTNLDLVNACAPDIKELTPTQALLGFVQGEADALVNIYAKERRAKGVNDAGMLIVEFQPRSQPDGSNGFNVYYCPRSQLQWQLRVDIDTRHREYGDDSIFLYLDPMTRDHSTQNGQRGFIVELNIREFLPNGLHE